MCAKLTDLLKQSKISFSYEVTPSVSRKQMKNVREEPLFYSVTWHAKGHSCDDLDIPPLKISRYLRSLNKDVLLHLSCDQLKESYLLTLLKQLQDQGLCNLFIVLGESFDESNSTFKHTKDLISFIRSVTGDYFCIGVAGYPDNEGRLIHLKEKVEAGADFIITQAIFDMDIYSRFEAKVRDNGIQIPIIPGIFLFRDDVQLTKFCDLCKVKIPNSLLHGAKIRELTGLEVVDKLLKDVIEKQEFVNFHFFTLNKLDDVSEFVFNFMNSLKTHP